jgi:cysteine desulfurase
MIYFDNAATTALKPEVARKMIDTLGVFGNPSSTHGAGRPAKALLENSRKKLADLLGVPATTVYFTPGGTYSDNLAIRSFLQIAKDKTLIYSPLEHAAITKLAAQLQIEGVRLIEIEHERDGKVKLKALKEQIKEHPESVLTLMQGNNELGNINPIQEIANWTKENQVLFHSDTVQTIAYKMPGYMEVDSFCGSAHKFYGPKGVGFLVMRKPYKPSSIIFGGGQEKGVVSGTENLMAIAGMVKAFELACFSNDEDVAHIKNLKSQLLSALAEMGIKTNGTSGKLEESLPHVVSLSIPKGLGGDMLLFKLDLEGFAISGGSACSSGSELQSPVMQKLKGAQNDDINLRVSFSCQNTEEEVTKFTESLKKLISVTA